MSERYECFTVVQDAGVAHLELSRPNKANSLTASFWNDLPKVVDGLSKSGKVRALVLSAQGDVFCAGLDLGIFASAQEFHAKTANERERLTETVLYMQDALSSLERARFPVIAAVQGACIGGGLDLLAACDVCFASQAAKFRIEETNIGMMADIGVLQRLHHLIPAGVARYLALTGETLSADDAHRIGLAVKLYPDTPALLEGAFAAARRIAARPPLAISGVKRSMLHARDHSVYESLHHAALMQASILNGADIQRAFQSRATGEAAVFDDLLETGKGL